VRSNHRFSSGHACVDQCGVQLDSYRRTLLTTD
jgi:hypothetical protein